MHDDSMALRQWFIRRGPELLRRLGVRPDQPVVDFGCGVGSLAIPLASVIGDAKVFVVDKKPDNLRALQQRAEWYGPFPNLCVLQSDGSLCLSELVADPCQAVFLFDVLQQVDDWKTLFEHCFRVLRPAGMLHVNPSVLSHPGRVDTRTMERILDSHGFLPCRRDTEELMHYKQLAKEEIFSYAKTTVFQRRVYRALLSVPPGTITTYGALARAVGCASARAVGQALRRNPCAPYVPCHRVIASDGSIGGFGGNADGVEIDKKRQLLAEEGVLFDENRTLDDQRRLSEPTVLEQR